MTESESEASSAIDSDEENEVAVQNISNSNPSTPLIVPHDSPASPSYSGEDEEEEEEKREWRQEVEVRSEPVKVHTSKSSKKRSERESQPAQSKEKEEPNVASSKEDEKEVRRKRKHSDVTPSTTPSSNPLQLLNNPNCGTADIIRILQNIIEEQSKIQRQITSFSTNPPNNPTISKKKFTTAELLEQIMSKLNTVELNVQRLEINLEKVLNKHSLNQ